ncbi:hypothetical protein [Sphingobium sp. B2]|nr:hypothetical protein [Sphingobium sp. B2]
MGQPAPVSYTHLDVYKRQGLAGPLFAGCACGEGRSDHIHTCLLYTSRCV